LTKDQIPQPEDRPVPKPEITSPNEKDTKLSIEPGQSFSPVLTGLLKQLLKSESAVPNLEFCAWRRLSGEGQWVNQALFRAAGVDAGDNPGGED